MFSYLFRRIRRRLVCRPSRFELVALAALAALALMPWSVAGYAQDGSQAWPLPALGVDPKATSVSGLSSGAFMASQFHIAYSSTVVGAGIVAGGPYACAEDAFEHAPELGKVIASIQGCMMNNLALLGVPDIFALDGRIAYLWRLDRIDPIAGLAGARVYLYSGSADRKVLRPIVDAVGNLYAQLGVPANNIKPETGPAGHAFVTETKGIECGETARPYVTRCGYDQAGEILRHIYGSLPQPKSAAPANPFLLIDQQPFTRELDANHGLDKSGFAYVPTACRDAAARCRVHVVFHGCDQQRSQIQDQFVAQSGFAEWADNNKLVILFPQVKETTDNANPFGCWDWWGYTGDNYLTRDAAQMVAVKRMLDQLARPYGSN
jgi:hypothetical protein